MKHKNAVTRDQLIMSFPIGVWFNLDDLGLNMKQSAFGPRMRKFKGNQVESRLFKGRSKYKVTKRGLTSMLKECVDGDEKRKKQGEIKNTGLAYEDILFNLVIGNNQGGKVLPAKIG